MNSARTLWYSTPFTWKYGVCPSPSSWYRSRGGLLVALDVDPAAAQGVHVAHEGRKRVLVSHARARRHAGVRRRGGP
eukprot:15472649-Alexandrium_andersonii.AAC.2